MALPNLHKPASRTQLLINLAIGISNNTLDEDLNMTTDVFMSSSYDPTQSLGTLKTAQNITNVVTSENINVSMFEELKDVTYENHLDPLVDQSEIDSSFFQVLENMEIQKNANLPSINKTYILDEVTGQLIEDLNYCDENINNNDDCYLNEKTRMLEQINKAVSLYEENASIISDNSSTDEDIISNRQSNKLKRLRGEKYTGRKKQHTGERARFALVPKPKKYLKGKQCSHSCISKSDRSYLCGLISEQKRKVVFDYFWSLTTWDAKKAYLKNLVRLRPVLRRRKTSNPENVTQKQLAYDYYVTDDQNVPIKVCKSFFVNTFNIHSDTLSDWIKKLQDVGTADGKDLRTKHEKRLSTRDSTGPDTKNLRSRTVKEWLDLIHKVPSHYCRTSSTRVYVEDTFESKNHLFRVYTEWCKDNNRTAIGRKLFSQILEEEKISIFKPRKDQCDTCTAKRENNISEEEYAIHIQKKNEAYKAHIEASALSSSEVLVMTIDVQSVLLCPKLLVSAQYYKQKLQVHNQSIYLNNNKDVHLYVWHEGDGGVTANEFTSCLIHFIKSQLNYKKIIIISDGCSYQNKNKILSSALLKLTQETGLEIEQIILEKGHTMMQVDSVHSTLEKKFRSPIYSPSDYISRMREARPKQPYHIHHVDYTFFANYENDVCLDSIRPGKKAGDPTVNDIRGLLYKNGSIFYKLRHPDEWQILPQRVRANPRTINVTQLYTEPRKIDKTKYDSLQSLKPFMHHDYHAFYDNLHYKD